MKWFWELWSRRGNGDDSRNAEERLANVIKDDEEVDRLQSRADKILRENNLAPYIMRALSAKGR